MKRVPSTIIAAAAFAGLALAAGTIGARAHHDVRVVRVTARRFEYEPSIITLHKGVPVDLELTSLDRDHGFKVPALGIRADVKPGQTTRVHLVPTQVGRFAFACDVFCGDGHEDMGGEIVVVD